MRTKQDSVNSLYLQEEEHKRLTQFLHKQGVCHTATQYQRCPDICKNCDAIY